MSMAETQRLYDSCGSIARPSIIALFAPYIYVVSYALILLIVTLLSVETSRVSNPLSIGRFSKAQILKQVHVSTFVRWKNWISGGNVSFGACFRQAEKETVSIVELP